jgi:hypothetical protein
MRKKGANRDQVIARLAANQHRQLTREAPPSLRLCMLCSASDL